MATWEGWALWWEVSCADGMQLAGPRLRPDSGRGHKDPRAEPQPCAHLVRPSAPAWCASDGMCLGSGHLRFSARSAQG